MPNAVPNNLKRFRVEKVMCIHEVANLLKVWRGTYVQYENSELTIPGEEAHKLAKIFDCSEADLFSVRKEDNSYENATICLLEEKLFAIEKAINETDNEIMSISLRMKFDAERIASLATNIGNLKSKKKSAEMSYSILTNRTEPGQHTHSRVVTNTSRPIG